jgi:hypothetical protein
MDDHVVGRVQAPARELVDQHGDMPVVLGARHAPRAVLARHQPPLPIAGVAIAVVGRRAKNADGAGFLAPAQHPVVRNVGKQQKATIAKPNRSLGPARASPQTLHDG